VQRCLRDPMFSRFGTVPACDEQTERQTDETTANTALAKRCTGKFLTVDAAAAAAARAIRAHSASRPLRLFAASFFCL